MYSSVSEKLDTLNAVHFKSVKSLTKVQSASTNSQHIASFLGAVPLDIAGRLPDPLEYMPPTEFYFEIQCLNFD